ncbi:MAG: redoxin domain-containing protein [Thermogemmatispora sp.]|uniref:TlpA family protein disulfide reductase n=1 Tax=Thermogemmatispora sp. TaxID=1968838 RepID=UPI0026324FBC|nr:redoxin domain-containing protein [Thermogemmatispora sp.]MBX5457010.1 redoxin domain-containing protein [Thermogemmatispora sp.]
MTGLWLLVFLVQWLLLIVLYCIVFAILRYLASLQSRLGQASVRVTRFEAGDKVSDFTLTDVAGQATSLGQFLQRGRKVLLLLLSASCTTCRAIVAQLDELASRPGGVPALGWMVVAVIYGQPAEVRLMAETLREREGIAVLVDSEALVARSYLVASIPIGLALDENGRVLDQSRNPGPNWLYLTLHVAPPDHSLLPRIPIAQIQ